MKVRNKLESIEIIKEKKLNSFPEKLFKVTDIENIKLFLSEYPAEYYAVRSKEIVGCKKNNFKVPKDKVLDEINADWFKSEYISCPKVLDNGLYEPTEDRHKVIFINDLYRNKIYQDFFIKMGAKYEANE